MAGVEFTPELLRRVREESWKQSQLDAAARAAGIERHVWPHLLRHTFASHLAEAGVSIWKVAKWLGHTGVQQTMRYAHLSPQHDEEIDRVG